MDLQVQRCWVTPQSTIGQMTIDGKPFCYTLEPRQDQSEGKPFCIPAGVYNVRLLPSNHFKMVTPHLMDVPGFTEIEIHPGNYPKDTEGCTLVGAMHMPDFIGNSDVTFAKLMKILIEPITATYTNPL